MAARPASAYSRPPPPTNGGPPSNHSRPMPHIKDLVIRAETQVNPNLSIEKLLETAAASFQASQTLLEYHRRPEDAYLEYLKAFYIVSTAVRQNKDLSRLHDIPRLANALRDLTKRINAQEPRFDKIRDMIREDNARNGMTSTLNQPQNDLRPTSSQISANRSWLATPSPTPSSQRNSLPAYPPPDTQPPQSASPKQRPPVQPKPQTLQADPRFSINSADPDERNLADRFAKLRMNGGHVASQYQDHPDRKDSRLSASSHPISMQAPAVRAGPAGDDGIRTASLTDGNSRNSMSVDTNPFPRPPDPTYTPTRSSMQPPRNVRMTTSPIHDQPSTTGSINMHDSAQLNGYTESSETKTKGRRKSMYPPTETEIDAQLLFDYLRTFQVLLVDARSREEHDQGHIFAVSGICIEPAALRLNMSAEELQEALVLSPDSEIERYQRRNEFDLVVFYDQSTRSSDFMSSQDEPMNPAMRYLHDALYEFNQEKPLQRPPILLVGGLDAWVDLLGPGALETSSTVTPNKPTSGLMRRPASSASRSQKRSRRDYNPIDPEEERKWRERARSESIKLDIQPEIQQPPEYDEQPTDSPISTFATRYPDVAAVEQQYVESNPPSRPAPDLARIPNYPAPPVPSRPQTFSSSPMSSVPSRPAPAMQRPSYGGVSERMPSQPIAPVKPSQLTPYIPPKLKRLPRTGLHNFGVTCYMNATIQCLSATIPLTAFFLDGAFQKYLQKENWKGSKGLMPMLYHTLLRNLWQYQADVDIIRPTNFRKFCARLNKEWGLDRQQDAKEFLEFLIDCLHEDLNFNWQRSPLRALSTEEEAIRENTPAFLASKKEWERYEHRDHSRLTDLFAGQHISQLKCTTCHNSSTTYEAFYSISVEIPAPSRPGANPLLQDCLRSYCQDERLAAGEEWRCPHCKTERQATKRITITRAPEFLVVHFKRFSASHAERARKINTPVDFPLTNFDLEPYMLPSPDAAQREYISRAYGTQQLEAPTSMLAPYRYDAYAVMRHLGGTIASGHYIALVQDRARGVWRQFNDDRVTDFQPEELPHAKRLQNEQAYIVFYQRRLGEAQS